MLYFFFMSIFNCWGFLNFGFGLGLCFEFLDHVMVTELVVDWFEIVFENYFEIDGKFCYYFDKVRECYLIVMYGVGFFIGSMDPLDFDYLCSLKELVDQVGVVWMGDHVCWMGVNGYNGYDFYLFFYNELIFEYLIECVRVVQDVF